MVVGGVSAKRMRSSFGHYFSAFGSLALCSLLALENSIPRAHCQFGRGQCPNVPRCGGWEQLVQISIKSNLISSFIAINLVALVGLNNMLPRTPYAQNGVHRAPSFPLPYQHSSFSTHEYLPSWLHWDSFPWRQPLPNQQNPFHPPCKVEETPLPVYPRFASCPSVLAMAGEVKMEEGSADKSQQTEEILQSMQKRALQLMRRCELTLEERQEIRRYRAHRMEQYKLKKERRNFNKKVVYDTRKRVADRRIRYKGKFINEEQAKELLGLVGLEFSFEDLKKRMKELRSTF